MSQMDDKLESLWAEYREAIPDPEPGANFMPALWRRIDARRGQGLAVLYRRWAEALCTVAVIVTVLLATFVIPRYQHESVYEATYVDVLNAADSNTDAMILPVADIGPLATPGR